MNLPLARRAGYNQGEQNPIGTDISSIGQPAVKLQPGRTIIYRDHPDFPGEHRPRALTFHPGQYVGHVFNRSGGAVEVQIVVIDADGNEFKPAANILAIADGDQELLVNGVWEEALLVLAPGWQYAIDVISGDVTAGDGVIVWPWMHNLEHNVVNIAHPVTTELAEFGPGPGRAWQILGSNGASLTGETEECATYANFDSVTRHVDSEILSLDGTDEEIGSDIEILSQAAGPPFAALEKGLILAYPDKIKVRATEDQTTAPLYLLINFAEFDLPGEE